MISRRRFAACSAFAAAAPFIGRAAENPVVRFGLAADAQYADVEAKGTRFYRQSLAKLTSAVEHFNSQPLKFCVHLGDLIDREWNSFGEISAPLSKSRHPFHHVLGNHDFDVLESLKARVPGVLGLTARYHFFDQGSFRFVFVDTTDVSTYAHPSTSPEYEEAKAELERVQALGLPQAKEWNSAMSSRQLSWLETTCRQGASRDLKVLVFGHHPLAPSGGHNLWNDGTVLKILTQNRSVVAWINGHNHAGAFAEHDGLPLITLHGMVETANSNAYAVAELHSDRLLLAGHGREPSREIRFRA